MTNVVLRHSAFIRISALCFLSLLVLAGGCYIEPYSAPISIPADYTPRAPQPYAPLNTGPQTAPFFNPSTATTAIPIPPQPQTLPAIDETTRDQILQAAQSNITKRFGVDADPRLNEYLILVGSLITINSPKPDVEYRYVLLKTDQPMSCAVWPKTICVSRGLLRQMEDESELAGAVAREISNLQSARPLTAAGLPVTEPATRPTTTPATTRSTTTSPAQAALINKESARLVDLLTKDGLPPDLEAAADLEGARFAAAAQYAPDGYLKLLTRLKPATTTTTSTTATATLWDRIKTLDANVRIVAKAHPHADVKLPARFESYMRPGNP